MRPEDIYALGYPENMAELIEDCEGVALIEETKYDYVIHDTYQGEDRVLNLNKEPGFHKRYFAYFGNDLPRDAIEDFARHLPDLLFMNLKKVYFVEQDEDLSGEVDEESPNHTFSFDDEQQVLGMAVYRDSVAFVNLRQAKQLAREEETEDQEVLGYSNGYERILADILCTTLAHELFHLMQHNPLIEEVIPDGEEAAEAFCRAYGGS